ncbi:enoyl-CoA hydratase/isomerase family protein [Ferrovibrio sp.]|uniref:enoyl-CoA hydratase/isomerase family protein n=1 Tax=Ferrovibrio sp. TaxID=1917215 RepID=UPI0025C0E450|nr:enoyl-CoA hydratase/isomerase family protein [Ferrovibrio sp.]MBX3455852.1 enoyl-CoA hydratase/isomerase family protein [Ferrovibrio sp.]
MSLVRLEFAQDYATLTLNRPQRHNSLIPDLVETLAAHAESLAGRSDLVAVLLQAEGPSFSTGGDVAGCVEQPRIERRDYADRVVGGLNRAILALLDLPMPLLGRAHGPITGGSLGLLLACDLVAVSERTFLQSYYVDVGFSPDGGWCALLPARIGEAKAREIQLLNQRVLADQMLSLGLAQALVDEVALDGTLHTWLRDLRYKQRLGVMATKRGLMPPQRRASIAAALEAEKAAFLDMIDRPETEAGMARFLKR